MLDTLFDILNVADDFYWKYIGVLALVLAGLYFSYRSGFYQVRVIKHLPSTIRALMKYTKKEMSGVSPLHLYFASIGGMIGVGNIAGAVTALTIGGPGALFWLWITAFLGMVIKYAEMFLGIKFRKENSRGGYDGGLMFCMSTAFKGVFGKILGVLSAILLCIYGAEIFQFTVVADTIAEIVPLNRDILIIIMLLIIIYVGLGEVKRLSTYCSFLMPFMILIYVGMCLWVVAMNYAMLPNLLLTVVKSAFTGHAAVGGFVGSTLILAVQSGASRAAYSGDIAVGFDSIIHSETKALNPQYQARLSIVASITDAFICTLSILVVLIEGLWITHTNLDPSQFVSTALSSYFPYAREFVMFVIFLAGFTTIQAYFTVGLKSARFLFPKIGKPLYFIFAISFFWIFSHYDQTKVYLIMTLSGGLLILINLICLVKMRKEIRFDILKEDKEI